MNTALGTAPAKRIMATTVITVSVTDKLDDVAKLFEVNDINAAPVLNSKGECVGIVDFK